MEGKEKMTSGVYKVLHEPDGHIFFINLDTRDQFYFKAYAIVIGGEHVADKYRVEIRLSSCEKQITNTHHGPVLSIDAHDQFCDNDNAFMIDKKRFAFFNGGFDNFGDHNKDKNGEITVPIMVKIIKKKLNIPKEEPGTSVDMDAEEK